MSSHLTELRQVESDFAAAMTRMYDIGNTLARLRAGVEQEERAATGAAPAAAAHAAPAPPITPPATPDLGRRIGTRPRHRPQPIATPPRTPWWQREGAVAKILAAVGAAVTLIGVTFLMAVAIAAGYFGPAARTVAGAVLAVALVAAGLYVHRRTGRVPSALGLTATGIAAAYLDLVAATAVYHFIPTVVGLSLAAVVAVAGLAIARQWSSELLAVIVVLGVAMLAPAIGADRHGVVATFLVLLTIASTTAHVGQPRWAWLEWARTAPTVAYLLWALTFGALTVSPGHDSVVALSVVLTLSLLAVTTAAARAPQVALLSAAPLALTALPTLYGLGRETGWAAFAGLLAIAVLHLGAGVMAGAQRGRVAVDRVAVWAPPIAAAFALVAIDQADFGSWQLTAVLVLALLHLARARISSDTVVGWTALVVSAVALLGWLAALGPLTVADRAVEITVEDLINHGLVLAVAVLLAQAAPRLLRALQGPDAGAAGTEPRPSSPVWIGGLVLGLGALSGVVVSAAVLLVRDPLLQPTAFQVGHALSTLAWLGIAAWLLMRGLGPSRSATLALRVGLGIALAAVAKLFLFDMSTLTSLARVLSFIPAGLILLGMGAGYAKALERARRGEPTPG